MPKASAPTINGLIVARIDDLQVNLSGQIHDLKVDLGERIQAVDERVKVQNSRIGKCEAALLEHATAQDTAARFSGRHMGAAVVGTALGSPVLIKIAEVVFAAIHKATP
jgi:hypothetical protein